MAPECGYPDPPRPLLRRREAGVSSAQSEDALAARVLQSFDVLERFVRDENEPGDRLVRQSLAEALHPGYQVEVGERVLSTGVQSGTHYLHRLPIEIVRGTRVHGLSRRLQFFRRPGAEGTEEEENGSQSSHRTRAESLGSALLTLIEAVGLDRTPSVDDRRLSGTVRGALRWHVVGRDIRANQVTFVGVDRATLDRASAVLRKMGDGWRNNDIPFVMHLAACSDVGDNFLLPAGTRRQLAVDERVGRFGDCNVGPFLVLGARLFDQLDSHRFAAAYAVPLTSLDRALLAESDPERSVQAVIDDEVLRASMGRSPSPFWLQKLLYGRGRPYEALEIDRLDHRVGARESFVDFETAGSHEALYVDGKVGAVTRSVSSRPVVVIDWAWAGRSQPRRDRILLELRLLVRRLLLAWRDGATVSPGLLAVIPKEGVFFERLRSLPRANTASQAGDCQ